MQNKNEENILYIIKNIKYNIILFITIIILFISFAFIYLKFSPHIYSAYTTIKIKSHNNKDNSGYDILNPISTLKTGDVKEHIALIKSFYMNNKALNLDKNNFKIRYFVIKDYHLTELLKEIPIEVEDIKIFDEKIQGKKIVLTPKDNQYTLQIKYSLLDKFKYILLGNSIENINKTPFEYNKEITTKYFKCKIKKLSNFNKPIIFILNNDYRYIYNKIIKKNLSITQIDKNIPIIKIEYKDNIRERAFSYLTSLTQSLILENIKNKREENRKISEFIDTELKKIKSKLIESEKKLESYRISNKVIEPSIQASTFIKELSRIDISLSENSLKRNIISSMIKVLKRGNHTLEGITPFLAELNDNTTISLIQDLEKSEIEKNKLLEEFTYKHPKIQALNKKISTIKHKIFSNIRNLRKSIYQNNKELIKIKEKYTKKLQTLPIKERKLISMKRDYEVSSTMYNFLLKRKAENDIVRVSTLSDYRIIDKVYASDEPISLNPINILITYTTIGLIVAFLIISIKEKNKIKSIESLKNELDIPIYGILSSKKDLINIYKNLNKLYLDEYINLRTNLKLTLNKIAHNNSNIILINSSTEKEDKNTIIINLATIFQKSKDKVIIVDLDMRNPILHKMIQIDNINSDICNYLKGDTQSIEEIKYPTIYKNLDFIPIKNRPNNPSELILSIYLSKLFEELKKRYDYIFVNTTPFDTIKDFRYISKFSNINLFIFKEYCTKQKSILELKNIIEQDNIKYIGAIYII